MLVHSYRKIFAIDVEGKREDEEIIQINHIQVLTVEKQWYAGIVNWKYRCQAVLLGKQINFVLLFCPEDCAWKLVV